MHLSSLVILFAAASATVSGTPTQSTCVQYYCQSASTQLACCSDTAFNSFSTKSGCEACMLSLLFPQSSFGSPEIILDVNNQSGGTCDPNHIYCCDTLDTAVRKPPFGVLCWLTDLLG